MSDRERHFDGSGSKAASSRRTPKRFAHISAVVGVCMLLLSAVLISAGCSGKVGWLDRRDKGDLLVQRASLKKDEGDPAASVHLLIEALESNPSLARAHLNLALLLHENEKDYVAAIYHYRRYLEMRPETEKKEMIENRIRVAGQLFAAGVVGGTAVPERKTVRRDADDNDEAQRKDERIKELETERTVLRRKLARLTRELASAQAMASLVFEEKAPAGDSELTSSTANVTVAAADQETVPAENGDDADVLDEDGQKLIRTYVVQRGDSLSSIAVDKYGDPSKMEAIWKANSKALADPNKLKVGQVIVLP